MTSSLDSRARASATHIVLVGPSPSAQGFHCPFDGRVCSGNRGRLLGNEPVCHGDLRTQNGIVRQVTLVMHCHSPPIAVEPPHTFASRSPCKGRRRIGRA